MASLYTSRVSRISSRPYMGLHTREYSIIYRGWRPYTSAGSPGSLPDHIWACTPESIQLFIEDQAFLRSYDSAHRPPPSSPLPLSLFLSLPECLPNIGKRYGKYGALPYKQTKNCPEFLGILQWIAELKSLPHKIPYSAEPNGRLCGHPSGVTGVCMYSIFFLALKSTWYAGEPRWRASGGSWCPRLLPTKIRLHLSFNLHHAKQATYIYPHWFIKLWPSALKGHGNQPNFLGFLQKSVPHESLTLHFKPLRFSLRIRGDIRNRQNCL